LEKKKTFYLIVPTFCLHVHVFKLFCDFFRHEARDIIRNSVGASEHDAVIFCGSGSTGAIHKIVQVVAGDYTKPRPIVFVGPYEHHSNLLPWKDIGATVITVFVFHEIFHDVL